MVKVRNKEDKYFTSFLLPPVNN